MDSNDLKKLLAGLSLVALVGGAGLALSGCASKAGGSAGATDTKSSASGTDKAAKGEHIDTDVLTG
jgi:radical SAM modification target selenobiotic family peptide